MKKQVLRLYRATDPANFKSWESAFLKLVRAKPTLVIWGDKEPISRRASPSGSTLKRSCTLRK
jgi:hypothetical protein